MIPAPAGQGGRGVMDDQSHYLQAIDELEHQNDELYTKLARLTEILKQNGGWCSHGVLMDRPYHPRCSNCVLNQARAVLGDSPAPAGGAP